MKIGNLSYGVRVDGPAEDLPTAADWNRALRASPPDLSRVIVTAYGKTFTANYQGRTVYIGDYPIPGDPYAMDQISALLRGASEEPIR